MSQLASRGVRFGSGVGRTDPVDGLEREERLEALDEKQAIDEAIGRGLDCIADALAGDLEAAMMKLHTRK